MNSRPSTSGISALTKTVLIYKVTHFSVAIHTYMQNAMEDVHKLQNKQKCQRPLSELLQEQQEPFMPMDFLRHRQHLRKKFHPDHHKNTRLTKINKKAHDYPSPTRKPNRLPGQSFKVGASDPLMSSLGLKLPLTDAASMRSNGRSQYNVSSPLRSPLKSPIKSSSCIKSPSRGAARLMEAAVRILEPGLHTCSRPRPSFSFSPSSAHVPTTVRYLLDQDHKINQVTKRRKRLTKISRKPQLDSSPCASQDDLFRKTTNSRIPRRGTIETSCLDRESSHNIACSQHLESSSSSSRESAMVGDSTNFEADQVRENVRVDKSWILSAENTLNAWQRASEALISAFRLSPAKDPTGSTHRKEGNLVHYSRIFSFNKGKKTNHNERDDKTCSGQNTAKYSLLKSILRRLTPAKEAPNKVNCSSERHESGAQRGNSIDTISKRFSNAMGSFSRGSHRHEMQRNDQVRLRIRDIVRWNSFEESDFHNKCVDHSSNVFLRERATSLEHQNKCFGDVMVERCLTLKTENVAKKANVITNKGQVDDWKVFSEKRKDVSSEFSFTSSSSAWPESSLDGDSVSTSLDVLSSTGSSEGSGILDSRELKGIEVCISEDECPRYFSLEIDQNDKAKDFHHSQLNEMNKSSIRTQLCDTACYESGGSAVSKETIQKDCMHCSKSAANTTIKSVGVRSTYDMMRSPARLHSSYTEVEEENEEISPMDDSISDRTGDDCSHNDNCEVSDSGCFEEAEQLSPVSVLDSPFEDTQCFEQTYATILRAKRQLLKKISEYEQLAHMDPLLLEKRIASWKDSSEDESGNCTEEDVSQRMGIVVDSTDISSGQTSPCTSHDEEMGWEEDVGAEDYARQVVHCSQTISEDLPPASPSTPLWGSHRLPLVDYLDDREVQVGSRDLRLEDFKAKHAARQAHKLLFDRVNEELQSSRRRYGCGFMAEVEPWLREQQQLPPEQLAKKIICGQMSSSSAWKEEVDTNNHADRIVELDFKKERQEWKMFREEAEEIGVNIELAIFGVLVEEVLLDLVQF